MTKKTQKDGYATVRLPQEFVDEIDKHINRSQGFTSRADVIKAAMREFFRQEAQKPKEPHLAMLNHDDRGVKIWDSELKLHAEVQIGPKGIYCTLCDATRCEHIRFTLEQSDIQKLIKQKGWKMPDA